MNVMSLLLQGCRLGGKGGLHIQGKYMSFGFNIQTSVRNLFNLIGWLECVNGLSHDFHSLMTFFSSLNIL